jgi:hypothetical protein
MPWVIAEPGLHGPKSYSEGRATYLCDWPDCANPAEEVLGCIAELVAFVAVCKEHAKKLRAA